MRIYIDHIHRLDGEDVYLLEAALVENEEEGVDPYIELTNPERHKPLRMDVSDLEHEIAAEGILRVRSQPGSWEESVVFGIRSTPAEIAVLRRRVAQLEAPPRFAAQAPRRPSALGG